MIPLELLSPAGSPDAGYAALHYGADAVFLGLPSFSARASADNFTADDLRPFTNYAHQLETRRSVYVTINTLVQDAEVPELLDSLILLSEIGVDAVIVQDVGVCRLIREHFPELAIHASTQMAIHSRAGARALRGLGVSRVVLARELTLEEIADVSTIDGLETEVFIHGALCYGYSGLCLMSSHLRGLSGNRGKCSYTCREAFNTTASSDDAFALSMKDLALPDQLNQLKQSGVSSLKIEGRKKSSLYVAAVTNYYRKLLDGPVPDDERHAMESDIRTIFSRPQTTLFSTSASAKGAVRSTRTKTHQGAPVGVVTGYYPGHGGLDRLSITVEQRTLEKFDGLQIEIPGDQQPFGFPAESIWPQGKFGIGRPLLTAEPGRCIEVELPSKHPKIPVDATVFCSFASSVKNSFKWSTPRTETFTGHLPVNVTVTLSPTDIRADLTGTVHDLPLTASVSNTQSAPLEPAKRDLSDSARRAFEKLSGTPFQLQTFTLSNPDTVYVPQSKLNGLRRDLIEQAMEHLEDSRDARGFAISSTPSVRNIPESGNGERWSIKVDCLDYLKEFAPEDLSQMHDIILDITMMDPADVDAFIKDHALDHRVRLALPAIARGFEEPRLLKKVTHFLDMGITRWALSNPSGMTYLKNAWTNLDVLADWPLYTMNSYAADELLTQGFSGITLSPEDTARNIEDLMSDIHDTYPAIILYQDTPLAISEACVMATDDCRKGACTFREKKLVSRRDAMLAINQNCRTILVNEAPFSLSLYLDELRRYGANHFRADFIWKDYTGETVQQLWHQLRNGGYIDPSHDGSYRKRI